MVTLFSNKCPKCLILEKKLNDKGIEYTEINDIDVMIEKGFMAMPVLEVDDEVMNFSNAVKWINVR